MALTTTFEKFAKKQRETNPDITDQEIQQLWSEQPLKKRIASGIESSVITPARAIASIPETVGAGYKKLDEFSRSGPNLSYKYEGGNKAMIAGKPNQALKESLSSPANISTPATEVSSPTGVGPVVDPKKYAESLASLPTSTVKDTAKKALATTDTAVEEAQKAADKGEIPQVEADRFKQERDRAYQMYNEAKTRNEWLELAQLLGQAVTQYGAAQVGMRTGRSMAGLQIPSVDYGTRTAQEQKLLESRLRDISGEQEREETLAERLRREKREKAADARAERELRLKEREAGLPKETAEDRAIRREERTEERKAYKEQLSALDKVVGAQEILASEDTNKKQKQKAEETLLEEANKAGLDIEQIRAQSQVPGILGGVFGTNLDQKKVLKTIKDSIESLKSSRRGAPTSDTVAPASAATLSTEDQQALEWAMNNPKDPRAAAIRQRLGK